MGRIGSTTTLQPGAPVVVAVVVAAEGHPRIALGFFTLKALLLFPPHAIVMRLHVRDSYVVILIPETADLLGL